MNTVQLMVFKVLMFQENTYLIPSGDSYDLSAGTNDPNEGIILVIFGIPAINQLGCVEVVKED